MNNIRPEDLGSMGESFFKTLCKSVGFIANSSIDDQGGWDFEVEHRQATEINYSTHSYPVYRVQVKSTTGKSCVGITFGNLLKLIRYNGASFIILIKYSESIALGKINPDRVYILHVNEEFSISILNDMRARQLKSNKFSLNKNEKQIKFEPENEIDPLNGLELKNYIEKCTGTNYLNYAENKLRYLSFLGKEGEKMLWNCTIDDQQDAEYMANCFLGYQENFKINVEEFYAPFGIKNINPTSTFTHYRAAITPHHDKISNVTVCFQMSEFGKLYKFIGKLYHTPRITNIPKKIRIKCDLFDIIIELDSNRMAAEIFPNDIEVEFKQLYHFVCFLENMSNNQKTLIKVIDHETGHTTEVWMDNPIFYLPNNFNLIYSTIKLMYEKFSNINIENNTISTGYILNNIRNMNLFSMFGEEYNPDYTLNLKGENNPDVSRVNAVIFSFTIFFKEINLVTFVAFYGSIEISGENILWCRFKKSEVLDNFILNHTDDRERIVKNKTEHFKNVLFSKGYKVLP